MSVKTLDGRKINLIVQISKLDEEESVRQVEDFINHLEKRPTKKQLELLKKLTKPIREKIDLEQLKREQNWKPSSQEEIDELIKKFDFQTSQEELIKEINDI